MKLKTFRYLALSLVLGTFICTIGTPLFSNPTMQMQPMTLSEDDMLKISETFGHFIGRNLKAPGIDLNVDRVVQGLRNGVAGKPAPLTDQEFETLMAVLQAQAFTEISEKNLKEANDFLENNKSQNGVISLESGKLQYEVLAKGNGNKVTKDSAPLINYKGSYIQGNVFGSSEETGGPIAVPLDQTVPGFSKGLIGMREGEKRKLYVHPDLGYGTTGALQPNALLIFEVEVLEADHKEEPSNTK